MIKKYILGKQINLHKDGIGLFVVGNFADVAVVVVTNVVFVASIVLLLLLLLLLLILLTLLFLLFLELTVTLRYYF